MEISDLDLGSCESTYTQSPLPNCPPNTAELDLHDSLTEEAEAEMLLCSFESSPLSLGLPLDSQGFALGVSQDTEGCITQSLALPSEPPELDLRDWILRHRIEPPLGNSHDEKHGDSQSYHDKFQTGGTSPAQTEKDPRRTSVFSRKNWDALLSSAYVDMGNENDEQHLDWEPKRHRIDGGNQGNQIQDQLLIASVAKERHYSPKAAKAENLGIQPNYRRNQSGIENGKNPIPSRSCPVQEGLPNSNGSQPEDMGAISERLGLITDTLCDKVNEESDQGKKGNPLSVSPHFETGDTFTSDSEAEDGIASDSETEGEAEQRFAASVEEVPSSAYQWSSDFVTAEKENLFPEEFSPSASSEAKNLKTTRLRKPLSDSANFQPQQRTDKWICPRINKKNFKPPGKQLSLDRWLAPPK